MTETVKIDLDELERKARAATQGEWTTYEHDVHDVDIHVMDASGEIYEIAIEAAQEDAAHIAAASPPVVLALISRIRDAERERDEVRSKLATAEMAIARAERIAKAATTFVDEQGKTMSRELLEHEHFDRADWDELVLEVERNAR